MNADRPSLLSRFKAKFHHATPAPEVESAADDTAARKAVVDVAQIAALVIAQRTAERVTKRPGVSLADLSGAERRAVRRALERRQRRLEGKYPVGATMPSMSQMRLAR